MTAAVSDCAACSVPGRRRMKRQRVVAKRAGASCLTACAAFALCVYLLRPRAAASTGPAPMRLRKLEHTAAGGNLGSGSSTLTETGSGLVAVVKLPKYTHKPGLGGIFFGKGTVGVHEDTKDPERVFGTGDVSAAGEKVRPLGFYFHHDIPQALKDAAVAAAPSASAAIADASVSLEHLQAVAKQKALSGASGKGGELGFYFAKDIPQDVLVMAKAGGRHLLSINTALTRDEKGAS